jgi:hypothetical protein
MDSTQTFVELFGDLATREGFRPMRRFVDVDERTESPAELDDPSADRPKSLTRIAAPIAKLEHHRSPKERARLLVEDAYRRAGECDCCDPRDLAEGLGLQPCPVPIKLPYTRQGVLYYPADAAIQVRGLGIYYELAVMLSPYADVKLVMDELILPTRTARQITMAELEQVQPNAPYQRVLTIYMLHGHRSGQWPAVR